MSGRVDDFDCKIAECKSVAALHAFVDARNSVGLSGRAGDGASELGLERQVALGVIAVVVGREDRAQAPALLFEFCDDRRLFRRVDRCRQARCRVVNEDAEVVGAAAKLLDDEGHAWFFRFSPGEYLRTIRRRLRPPV